MTISNAMSICHKAGKKIWVSKTEEQEKYCVCVNGIDSKHSYTTCPEANEAVKKTYLHFAQKLK